MQKGNKKRVAVCFYGQLRGVKLLENHFTKWLSKEYEFDFFMSTWKTSYNVNFPFTDSEYLEEFDLKDFKGNPRVAKACYLINKVVRLKESYELQNKFSYDLVILTRTDISQDFKKLSSVLNDVYDITKQVDKPVVSLSSSLRPSTEINENAVELTNDTTFIYNQDGANLHANLYNLIFLQNKNGDYSELKSNNGHYIHSFLYCHYNFLMLTNPLEELSRHDGSLL